MDEQNYNNEVQFESTESLKERRGTFLTVLCILSWISAGGTFLTSISTLIQGKTGIQNQIIESEAQLDNTDNEFFYDILDLTIKQLYISLEHFYPIFLSSLIISALGIYAVYLMYNLKKTGYYLYVAYALIAPLVSYYFVKDLPYSIYGFIFSIVISLIFIMMYGANLKRMTN